MPLPYIPFPECAESVIIGANSGDATYLTLGWQRTGGFSTTDLGDLAGALETWVHNHLIPRCGVAQTWNEIKVTDISSASGPVVDLPISSPNAGSHSGDTVPVQVAMVVSLYTANRGRSYRGRNYVPGLTLNQMSDGTTWGSTPLSDMDATYAALQADLGALGFNLVVLSRFNAGVRRTTGVSTLVLSAVAKAPVGTQRRRVIGHGI